MDQPVPTISANHGARLASGLALALSALVFLLFCGANGDPAALNEYPLDDAWIHQVYVRSLLTEGCPCYNPGVPETGFSSPLWLLVNLPLHAVSDALGQWPVVLSKFGSLAFAVWTALALGDLSERFGGGLLARMAAVAVAMLSPGLAFSAVSAMEVSLATAMIAQALLAADSGAWRRVGLWAGLAGLARPEAGLIVVVLAVYGLARKGGGRLSRLAWTLGVPGVLGGSWLVYNALNTGHPLPNTFYAKVASQDWTLRLDFLMERILFDRGAVWFLVLGVLGGLGLVEAWRRREQRGFLGALLCAGLGSIAVIALVHPLYPEVRFYIQRYFYPFTALGIPLVALGVEAVAAQLKSHMSRGLAATLAVVPLLAALPPLLDARIDYRDHCRDIHVLHTTPALQMARSVPQDVVIAVEGAGAARYHGQHLVLDLLGLNYHPLVHTGGDDELRSCLIMSAEPRVFAVPRSWLVPLGRGFELSIRSEHVSEAWAVMGGRIRLVVVVAEGRPRPLSIDCQARFGLEPGSHALRPE
jgi:hypothetical protein